MFDKQELAQLGILLETQRKDIVNEVREETHALIAASENRILQGVASILDISILPQIAELQLDVAKIKRHVKLA